MHPDEPTIEAYSVIGPGEGAFVPSISVRMDQEPEHDSLEKLVEAEAGALAETTGVQVLEREAGYLQGQHPQEELLICWVVEGKVMFQRRHHLLLDGVAYTLVLTFLDDSGLGSYPEGEAVMRSFVPGKELTWEGMEEAGDTGQAHPRVTARMPSE